LKLVLASRSPRRAELLKAAGFEFTVRAADIDETPREGEDPRDYVCRLAKAKACAMPSDSNEILLAADTTVVLEHEILGKPTDSADAVRMLRKLSGKRHEVITAICLRRGNLIRTALDSTTVWFAPMTGPEIDDYAASGEPMDKAGAYGIQGRASVFIDRIEGSYTNVVGLPISLVYRNLKDLQ
jgi:septum formation protein